jgi:anti-anti-sigma regulatory factor
MEIKTEQAGEVTILRPQGDIDASNFQALLDHVRSSYDAGTRRVLLDMSQVPYMSSAGLVAMQGIIKILKGEGAPDEEAGWDAFHDIDRERESGMQQVFKILGPQPPVDKSLEMVGFKGQYIEVYTDESAALASFQ